jgi:hypothetical protein
MGMHIKVKQLYANMGEHVVIIFRPFLDFMDSFKFSLKLTLMLAMMLDPHF